MTKSNKRLDSVALKAARQARDKGRLFPSIALIYHYREAMPD